MAFDLRFLPEGDEDMRRLEADPTLERVVRAAHQTLGRLELDPGDRRLRTRQFQTPEFGHVRMTWVGLGEWRVFWQTTDVPNELLVRRVVETPAT